MGQGKGKWGGLEQKDLESDGAVFPLGYPEDTYLYVESRVGAFAMALSHFIILLFLILSLKVSQALKARGLKFIASRNLNICSSQLSRDSSWIRCSKNIMRNGESRLFANISSGTVGGDERDEGEMSLVFWKGMMITRR